MQVLGDVIGLYILVDLEIKMQMQLERFHFIFFLIIRRYTCVNVNQSSYPTILSFPLLDIQCFFNSKFTRFVRYKYESYKQKI